MAAMAKKADKEKKGIVPVRLIAVNPSDGQ
jgi:hypothetical protein